MLFLLLVVTEEGVSLRTGVSDPNVPMLSYDARAHGACCKERRQLACPTLNVIRIATSRS